MGDAVVDADDDEDAVLLRDAVLLELPVGVDEGEGVLLLVPLAEAVADAVLDADEEDVTV